MNTFFKDFKLLLAIFSISLATLLPGCGGGGGSATPPATPTYSISGTVSGAVLQGVAINLTGGGMYAGFQASTTTDASGNYSFTGLPTTGSYIVTPTMSGYAFSSNSLAVSVNGANVTGTNFTATANTAATYSISGTVSGLNSYAVMITLGGGTTGTTFTDYNGNYSFTGLVNASYTVTPSYAGNSYSTGFSPSVTTVTVNSTNVPNTNFTATYTLSGKVRIGNLNGAGLQGVTINLAGATTATTITDANGSYTISGLTAGSNYTVVPSLAGYSFSPASSVVGVYSNMPPPNTDFNATPAATTYSISGTVSGAILQNVMITLSGANTGSVLTDASGNYIISGLVNGNYTVTPSLAGYSFNPLNSAVTINGANATAINFVAAVSSRISGSVSGAIYQGVTINLTGATNASTTTGAAGDYNFLGLANGSYTVTPSLAGYTFSPASSAVTINGADSTANNFVSSVAPVSYSISGTVSGAVLQGVTVNLTGASNASTITDASGNYTISGLANGSYTVTPTLTGYTFTPANRAVTINGVNSTANNFVSAALPAIYSISGTVSGAVLQGVTVYLTGAPNANTITDASGNYTISGLANGSYIVTPIMTGFIFSPISSAASVSGANLTGKNFTATVSTATTYISSTSCPVDSNLQCSQWIANGSACSYQSCTCYFNTPGVGSDDSGFWRTRDASGNATGVFDCKLNGGMSSYQVSVGSCSLMYSSQVTSFIDSCNTATFALTTSVVGSGTVSASPSGPSYSSGTVVTLTAAPNAGSTFSGWSGACTGTGPCMVTMNAVKAVTATFTSQGVTGTWSGSFVWPGASYTGCPSQTISVTTDLVQNGNNVTGTWGNYSGTLSGTTMTMAGTSTIFGTGTPQTWTWDGANTIQAVVGYGCYDLNTLAILQHGYYSVTLTRQ